MLKTISAALLAVSVIAAPVFAANTSKTTQAPVTKSATVIKSATVNPSAQVKKNPLNANAKMGRHHVRHHRHHRSHKMAAKVHKSLKVSAKPVTHPAKRG
jgi:hypothetical protein